ncbi:hypothetical protein C9426_22385 [Serratia sp. S1B]|nr:hypothetical protein C9426_22385 [Serratia sp. S1B]
MKQVGELTKSPISDGDVFIEGYIVYLNDGGLYIIDINYGHDYLTAPSILIKNNGLSDNLENNVSLYGGGETRLFHRAKLEGILENMPSSDILSVFVKKLDVEDNGNWISIDINKHYEPRNKDNLNWNDIFKEG